MAAAAGLRQVAARSPPPPCGWFFGYTGSRMGIGEQRPPEPEPWLVRAYRLGRALVVGSGATLADFSVFTTCVRAVGIAPSIARVPALLVGAVVQFFGNRSFTFRAQSGSLSRQAKLFLLFESVTLGLNWIVFHALEQGID